MALFFLIRTAAGLVGLALLGAAAWLERRTGRPILAALLTATAAAAGLLVAASVWVLWEHLRFPFQLEAMELAVLQHAERFAAGQVVYPEPSHEFIALAYNPGLYVVVWPLLAMAPSSLPAIRLPAVLSTLALVGLFGWIGGRAARSWRWGIVTAALPVLATKSFDGYLSSGHGDAPMILAAVAGALALGGPGLRRGMLAALLFAVSFWMKQPGGVLGLGAGVFLALRDGRRAALPIALLAGLGPVAFLGIAPAIFGPDLLRATVALPASWASWGWPAIARLAGFVVRWWAVPALAAAVAYGAACRDRRLLQDPLLFLLPFALLTAVIGALDLGSNDNVFATFGIWCLLILAREAGGWLGQRSTEARRRWAVAALVFCAAFLVHDVRRWLPSGQAAAARADLDALLRGLDGPLYAPWMGNPPAPVPTTARAHWVALEDRVRGNEVPSGRDPWIMTILEPVAKAPPPAYLLLSYPLEDDRLLGWLAESYVLEADLGERFEPLRELPHRYGVGPPRYLYRRRAG